VKTLLLLATLLTCACGDGAPDPEGDEYVKCSNFCGEDGVREFKRSDNGYNCFCYNTGKA